MRSFRFLPVFQAEAEGMEDERTKKWRESFQRNRQARRAALSPEERRELVRRERERFVAAAKRGWTTRRAGLGLDGPAERTVAERASGRALPSARELKQFA